MGKAEQNNLLGLWFREKMKVISNNFSHWLLRELCYHSHNAPPKKFRGILCLFFNKKDSIPTLFKVFN